MQKNSSVCSQEGDIIEPEMDGHVRHPTYARPALPATQKDRLRK